MNKDKELEEAKKKLELMEYKYTLTNNDDKAIETVLQELKCQDELIEDLKLQAKSLNGIIQNSVNKKKIEDKIEENSKLFFKTKDVRYANRFKVLQELLEE